jgi:hypothetical protein
MELKIRYKKTSVVKLVERLTSLMMRNMDYLNRNIIILLIPMPHLFLSLYSQASVLYETYLSTVNFSMPFQRVRSDEAFLTYITFICFYSSVSFRMSAQSVPVLETPFTIRILANISPFFIVPPLVSSQFWWLPVWLPAARYVARVGTRCEIFLQKCTKMIHIKRPGYSCAI